MFDIRDIMKTEVVTVKKDTPIYEAMERLVEHNITGLPVVDENMSLVGIVTEKDMLRLVVDLDVLKWESELDDSSTCVAKYMTEEVVSFAPEDSLLEICDCLLNKNFRRIPIVSDGKLVGILSRKDIIGYMLELRHKEKSPE
ncbi:MAG: CBS domain-containing protein [Planctomycetes bacterium]|nr:CBS domain-containing protein [Planctomycetota bacterium]